MYSQITTIDVEWNQSNLRDRSVVKNHPGLSMRESKLPCFVLIVGWTSANKTKLLPFYDTIEVLRPHYSYLLATKFSSSLVSVVYVHIEINACLNQKLKQWIKQIIMTDSCLKRAWSIYSYIHRAVADGTVFPAPAITASTWCTSYQLSIWGFLSKDVTTACTRLNRKAVTTRRSTSSFRNTLSSINRVLHRY